MERISWKELACRLWGDKKKEMSKDMFILLIGTFVFGCLITGAALSSWIFKMSGAEMSGAEFWGITFVLSIVPGFLGGIGWSFLMDYVLSAHYAAGWAIKHIKNKTHRLPWPLKTLWFALLLFPGVIGHLPHLVWWLAKMIFSPRRWAKVAARIAEAIRNRQQNRRDPRLKALAVQEDKLRKELKAVRRGADGELTARIERNLSQIQELRRQILAEAESERQARIRLHHEAKIEAAEAVIDEIRQLIKAEVTERQEDGERLAVAYDEAEQAANGKALEELFQDR